MPTIRIDPGGGKGGKRTRAQTVGALAAAKALPLSPVAPFIGAYFGDLFGQVVSNFGKDPTYPFEVDTETNKLTLITPPPQFPKAPKYKALQPRIDAANEKVRAALQASWDTGVVATGVPKRYIDEVETLLAQRAGVWQDTSPAPSSTDAVGAQYTGDYSMAGIIPPGGFAGFAQMTPASKAAQGFGKLLRSARKATRRKKKAKAGKRKRKASGKRRGKKLVKGSAAAKRFMANLRRKRK